MSFAASVLAACAAVAEMGNPVVRMYPANVVYRQGFDEATLLPDVGRVEKVQDAKTCEFAEGGVFGKCLAAGSVRFDRDADGVPFMNTLASGTMVCWVRYVADPPEGEKTGFTWSSPTWTCRRANGGCLRCLGRRPADDFAERCKSRGLFSQSRQPLRRTVWVL